MTPKISLQGLSIETLQSLVFKFWFLMHLVYQVSFFKNTKNKFLRCPNASGIWIAKCSECDRMFIQSVSCKKEICEVCGQEGSGLHLQRVKRWLPKVLKMWVDNGYIGYLVITIPQKECYKFKDKEKIRTFRRYVIRKLKRMGVKGRCRYHWAGEAGGRFHPHLNIICNKKYFTKEELEDFKKDIAKWLKIKNVVIKHKFKSNLKYVIETICYVCRPTLNLIKDIEERLEINQLIEGEGNGRNSLKNDIEFGRLEEIKFDDEEEEGVVEMYQDTKSEKIKILIEQAEKMNINQAMLFWLTLNRCPFCRKKIKWRYCVSRDYTDHFWIEKSDQIYDLRVDKAFF